MSSKFIYDNITDERVIKGFDTFLPRIMKEIKEYQSEIEQTIKKNQRAFLYINNHTCSSYILPAYVVDIAGSFPYPFSRMGLDKQFVSSVKEYEICNTFPVICFDNEYSFPCTIFLPWSNKAMYLKRRKQMDDVD